MSDKPGNVTNMVLPKGGKKAWTKIMQGTATVPDELPAGDPVVMAYASFKDGTRVAGGVRKSDTPTDYNIKFMWVFDANGNRYPGWPIDVSDDEDFLQKAYSFSLTEGADAEYLLNIVEAKA
jgi:hypothetical protein